MNLPESFQPLQVQLLSTVEKFATDAQPLSELLAALVTDVEKATAETLEIFPVCHHSPASALQMIRRLRSHPPRVIYMEMCEDLRTVVENLRDCKLPVALQAFAAESETFSPQDMPLSVVAPLTESSAEYQAIAFALENPQTTLVFVDRAVDYVFQWQERSQEQPQQEDQSTTVPDEAKMHGMAVGLEMGSLTPSFDLFLEFLLKNSQTRHFAEWWEQYVEQAIINSDYHTYRQVMFLIGSLLRRLGVRKQELESDRLRERYMWTRIKQHLQAHQIPPQDAIYICGAAHAASDVPEFGTVNNTTWEIPPLSQTTWLYGLIPSSFAAIEYQFAHPAGTVSMAETTWKKNLKAANLKAFSLASKPQKPAKTPPNTVSIATPPPTAPLLTSFLTIPPAQAAADNDQLLQWCADIVGLARKNGYLASTADAIAIYQTSLLLAGMRNRLHPTPYDFQDAAITCLEKDRTPKKRNIYQLCQILLGGDRIGMVGYASLPPLAQNIYDRLAPLNINLQSQTNQRALMDFKQEPQLLPCSDVLWRIHYILGVRIVQPIMGERSLGFKPLQESWEIRIGKNQRELIMLAYEGVSLEQVIEQRLQKAAFDSQATAQTALTAAEDSILYLHSPRLTTQLGEQAISLLLKETGANAAPEIFTIVRRLVHYYRTTPTGLPQWVERFVTTGYSHYATLLPQAFSDRGTKPEQIAGMLGFIFTLESLALSLGCNRSQLVISVKQAACEQPDPAKLGLLWTTEWLLSLRSLSQMREFFQQVLSNDLLLRTLPDYLNGFILSLEFAPRIKRFVVELLAQVFGSVPDNTLLPWLPNLILRLRPHRQIIQNLIKEAANTYPQELQGFANWLPFWEKENIQTPQTKPQVIAKTLTKTEIHTHKLLFNHRETTNAIAQLLKLQFLQPENIQWQELEQELEIDQQIGDNSGDDSLILGSQISIQNLIKSQPATITALAKLGASHFCRTD